MAVIVAGLLSINSGLVLSGSSFTFERAWDGLLGRDTSDTMENMDMAEGDMDMGKGDMQTANDSAVTVDPAGIQHIRIEVRAESYSPARVRARAGLLTMLILVTKGLRACTNGFVLPSANLERSLPETGETVIDLGTLAAGRIEYICSAGMYGGVIEVS